MDWIDEFEKAWKREYSARDTSSLLLITRLARLSFLIDAFQSEVLEDFELTRGEYNTLAALRRPGAPYQSSPSKLYTELEQSSGGMTKMLRRLENRGYLERAADPEDGRGTLVALTPGGLEVEEQIFRVFLARTHDLLDPVPKRTLAEIDRALRSLLDAIETHFYR